MMYKPGHITGKFRSKKMCGIDGCQRYHNSLLHNKILSKMPYQTGQRDRSVQPMLNCRLANEPRKQLFKMLPIDIYGPNGKYEILSMFDEGSAITILEEDIARKIGVRGQSHPLTLQWYNDRVVTEQSFKVNVEIGSRFDDKKFTLKDVYTVNHLNLTEQSFTKENFEHFGHVPLQNYSSTKPSLLIGLNQAYLGVTTTWIQGDNDSPIAAKTSLGWVAYGPTKSSTRSSPRVMVIKEQNLHKMVSDYFEADSFGVNPTSEQLESDEDKQARHILETTTILRPNKHYEVGLLWKKFPPQFPSSREMAERRLFSIEKRMHKDEKFAERYKEEMAKYVEKGYARKVTQEEVTESYAQTWYLPHFAVCNPHKPSKLRIVFDAAATANSTSLNASLLKGPEQAQPLMRILLQFRQGRIGVAADI
ncbi:uncharacterized protein [Eurosta solidaginis]|uniref:uncharacterized protein isoform X2 n=1 Tax=Eurosta solidaginis TaxID=178769 RepID=UPI003531469B